MLTNITSERTVLAGLYRHSQLVWAELVDILNEDCFTEELHQAIYKTLVEALKHSDKIDKASIIAASETLNLRKYFASHTKEVQEIFALEVEPQNVKRFAQQIRRLDIARKLHYTTSQSQENLSAINGDETLDNILNIVEDPIYKFCHNIGISQDNEAEKMDVGLDDYVSDLIANPVDQIGIPTGFKYMDAALGGGIIHGGFALIGARMKVGKSTLAGQIALNTSIDYDVPTLLLDTEMFKQKQWYRMLSNLTEINVDEIRTGQFSNDAYKLNLVDDAVTKLKKSKLSYKNVAGKNFSEILSISRRWLHKNVDLTQPNPKCMIILDYFKLSGTDTQSEHKEYQLIGFQASALSDFCIKYNVPAIAFVQLNRDGIQRDSTDVISQSDRLGWSCTSFTIFRNKSKEEIDEDGVDNGNRKLIPLITRDGEAFEEGEWINVQFTGKHAKVREINTNSEAKSQQSS